MSFVVFVPPGTGRSLCTPSLSLAATWIRMHPGAILFAQITAKKEN